MLLLAGSTIVAGCYNDKADALYPSTGSTTCDTTTVTFATQVLPIMVANCAISGCHDASSVQGGYDLSSYNGVKQSVDNQRLLGSINWENGYQAMPQNTVKLTQCDINKITRWVNTGALNN